MGKRTVVAPAIIDGEEFEGDELLSGDEWAKLVVKSFHNVGASLLPGWNESPTVIVIAELTNDCSLIDSLGIVTEGKVFGAREKLVAANKIWNFKQKQLKLKIFPLDLGIFRFMGRMWSEFVDSTEVKAMFINEGEENLELNDLGAQGYAGFSLRLFLLPLNVTQARITMILYPFDKEALLKNHPLAVRPEFPGVSITVLTADLGIQKGLITEKSIGCPILPAIKSASPVNLANMIPTPAEVSSKISTLFANVRVPEVKTTVRSLWERMSNIKAGGENQLEAILPETLWRAPMNANAQISAGSLMLYVMFMEI